MDQKFDLILVADHLDESLILLRHQMCLSINQVTSLSKNISKNKQNNLPKNLEAKIKSWESVDSHIFSKGMTQKSYFTSHKL